MCMYVCECINVCFCSVAKSCLTVCDRINCSTPGFPVLHYLPELLKLMSIESMMHAIHPSHPLLSPSSALNLSQHQGLFQWVSSSHQVAKVLELEHRSFQWKFRIDFLWDWLVWSPCSPSDSRVFSITTVWKHQFSGAQPSLWSPGGS